LHASADCIPAARVLGHCCSIDDEVQRPDELEPRAIKAYRILPKRGTLPRPTQCCSTAQTDARRHSQEPTHVDGPCRQLSGSSSNARPSSLDTQSPAGSRKYSRTDSSTCSLSRLAAQSNDHRQQSSRLGAILDPCPTPAEQRINTARSAYLQILDIFSHGPAFRAAATHTYRNHEPAPAEQGGH
jgi:hypothetical protein